MSLLKEQTDYLDKIAEMCFRNLDNLNVYPKNNQEKEKFLQYPIKHEPYYNITKIVCCMGRIPFDISDYVHLRIGNELTGDMHLHPYYDIAKTRLLTKEEYLYLSMKAKQSSKDFLYNLKIDLAKSIRNNIEGNEINIQKIDLNNPNEILFLDIGTTVNKKDLNITNNLILDIALVNFNGECIYNTCVMPKYTKDYKYILQNYSSSVYDFENAPYPNEVLLELQEIFDNAKLIVTYNGNKFDVPLIEQQIGYKFNKEVLFDLYEYMLKYYQTSFDFVCNGINGTYKLLQTKWIDNNKGFSLRSMIERYLPNEYNTYNVLAHISLEDAKMLRLLFHEVIINGKVLFINELYKYEQILKELTQNIIESKDLTAAQNTLKLLMDSSIELKNNLELEEDKLFVR